ncbi:MAG: DUF502 domain-containing protein [Halobacteriota archaeon]
MNGQDLLRTLRTGFVSGVVVVAPLVVTWLVLSVLFGWLVSAIEPLLALWPGETGFVENAVALILLVGAITGLGIAFRRGTGDELVVQFDHVMERIPIVRTIYSPTREASTALLKHGDQFERVVLVEWPREGVYTLGFVTDETPDRLSTRLPESAYVDVYIPMSPNPMGGYLTIVARSKVIATELSVTEGLRIVVTTGLYGDREAERP